MKRLFDILFSGFGLLFLLPLLTLIGISVALTSKGGVFYKQIRVGKGNIDFSMLKFRTMYTGADKGGKMEQRTYNINVIDKNGTVTDKHILKVVGRDIESTLRQQR